MEIQHFSHQHPLVFIEEWSNENEKVYCSGCGEMWSAPTFSCVECGFHLHKQCAEAPSEMNHPFHRNHSFHLLKRHQYIDECPCDFCNQTCENFVYHCPCKLDLHIKCALFLYNIAQQRIAEFQHFSRIDPLISTENRPQKLEEAKCFACWKPLLDSVYFSPDCGFYLHVKCVDLSAEINHLLHPQHPLILQFNSQRLSCKICQKPQDRGLVYSCSSPCEFVLHIECSTIRTKLNQIYYHRKHPLTLQFVDEPLPCHICQETKARETAHYLCSICKFVLHVGCVSLPPIIEDKLHHEHPFTRLPREVSLICDACGTSGNFVPYICSTCGLIVHKKCISLPPIIKFYRHPHPVFHTYFLEEHGFETLKCGECYEEVNIEHGSYFCSKCNYIVHVNCALKHPFFYKVVDSIETEEAVELSFKQVTDTSIKHFSHDHDLTFSEDIKGDKQCDGCLLSISASYYYCSQCDFFLHKSCAELPMKKHIWYHFCQRFLRLASGCIFQCFRCGYETSGFAYTCHECKIRNCLRCALVRDITGCEGHQHLLEYYNPNEGLCNACGGFAAAAYKCKSCNFNLHRNCIRLPLIARHKYDRHPCKLTYHGNDYSESNYCDICEEERNPNHWFYHCGVCNNSAHPKCVLGENPFIKPGSICKLENHPHPLTFVRQVHYYPECVICGKHCLDLALECKVGCRYIVHWKCIKPDNLLWGSPVKLLSN